MFRLLESATADRVAMLIDGTRHKVPAGVSVAAALCLLDRLPFESASGTRYPRAPYCMMGACFNCLVRIDGDAHQRACMVEVSNGMRVETALDD